MHDAQAVKMLKSEDHMRGMHVEKARITKVTNVSSALLRFEAELLTSGNDPAWGLPNVAFRLLLGGEVGGLSRIYTVRSFDPGAHTITVDVVIHGSESPMMVWAKSIRIGEQFSLLGPRPHFGIPTAGKARTILAADETAIPALCSLLTQLPPDTVGEGWAYCRDRAVWAELPQLPMLPIHWLPQTEGEPAGRATERPLVVKVLAVPDPDRCVVWAAGERDEMKEIRNHFRRGAGLGKDEVSVFGYWKRGMDNTQVDMGRLRAYQKLKDAGTSLDQLDDLTLDIESPLD